LSNLNIVVSAGKFYAGEAVLMIEHMEKSGKIEQTGDYHVYRRRTASPDAKSNVAGLSRKEFFPLSTYISIERLVHAE
jgi:hypothetical protein